MGSIVVFDADVLIAFMSNRDPHRARAIEVLRAASEIRARRLVSAVNYTELLIWPWQQAGGAGADLVDEKLARLQVDVVPTDARLARRAASVRARTGLKLPDAYAIATALTAEAGGHDVRLESFDKRVVRAFAELR